MADDGLESLSREELIARLRQLQGATGAAGAAASAESGPERPARKRADRRRQRRFDMSKYRQRHIALQVAYAGAEYHGLAFQDGLPTVEKTCLITDRSTCKFSRCGRTDKGVSAMGQVVALHVRSRLRSGVEFADGAGEGLEEEGVDPIGDEMDYPMTLNSVLPPSIRVLGWAPVPANFSARFSCGSRLYRYFFPRRDRDVERLVGEHDFRNFCKMDVVNVSNYRRTIHRFDVKLHASCPQDRSRDVLYFEILGNAFLWHQVRLMTAVLFLIGEGKEEASLVDELLDVSRHPRRPAYEMADDAPLVLHECAFPGLQFNLSEGAAHKLTASLEESWWRQRLGEAQTLDLIRAVEGKAVHRREGGSAQWGAIRPVLPQGKREGPHKPLLKRALGASYDEALESLSGNKAKRRREAVEKSKRAEEDEGESAADLARKVMQELASKGQDGGAAAAGAAGE